MCFLVQPRLFYQPIGPTNQFDYKLPCRFVYCCCPSSDHKQTLIVRVQLHSPTTSKCFALSVAIMTVSPCGPSSVAVRPFAVTLLSGVPFGIRSFTSTS